MFKIIIDIYFSLISTNGYHNDGHRDRSGHRGGSDDRSGRLSCKCTRVS